MKERIVTFQIRNYKEFQHIYPLIYQYLEEVLVEDPMLFQIAIAEAVNNAIKHSKRIQHRLSIRIKMSVSNQKRVMVRVWDNGQGFDVSRIFEQFSEDIDAYLAQKLLESCGRGIPMMLKTCDKVKYNAKGNEVLLCKEGVKIQLKEPKQDNIKGKEDSQMNQQNQLLIQAMNHIQLGIMITDGNSSNSTICYINQGLLKITGYVEEEVIGKSPAIFLKERSHIAPKDIPYQYEALWHGKNNEVVWIEIYCNPVMDADNDLKCCVWLIRDITERKRKEKGVRKDVSLAKLIQRNVIAPALSNEQLKIHTKYFPAHDLSGDMCIWFPINPYQYGICILDVMGHGISASLISMSIRSLLENLIKREKCAEQVIKGLNDYIYRLCRKKGLDHYCTATYLFVDTQTQSIEYINGGNPPGVILYKDGTVKLLKANAMPIGLMASMQLKKETIDCNQIHKIILYTDGIFQWFGGGLARLAIDQFIDYIHRKPVDNIIDEVAREKIKLGKLEDDVCMMEITFKKVERSNNSVYR